MIRPVGPRWLGALRDVLLLSVLTVSAGCGASQAAIATNPLPAGDRLPATGRQGQPDTRAQTAPASLARPPIVWDPIPFGPKRKAETVAYVRRHYGSFMRPTWRLVNPHVIVIHFTVSPDFSSTYNTFAADVPDPELHELPGTCAHFVIDRAGTIHQLVSLRIICRHTVGLNWTAIGIEHVGYSDAQVLGDHKQISASLRLVRWLRCRFHIPIKDVIGHNESLSSPYHREDVAALRTQTHADFDHADMQAYRARLRRLGGCERWGTASVSPRHGADPNPAPDPSKHSRIAPHARLDSLIHAEAAAHDPDRAAWAAGPDPAAGEPL